MNRFQPLLFGIIAALVVLALGVYTVNRLETQRVAERREAVLRIATAQAVDLQRQIDRSLAATSALAAVLHQTNGELADFDSMARQLLEFYAGISAIELAPDNVIRFAYPPIPNDAAIGANLMSEARRSSNIARAVRERVATFAGPVDLIRGGKGLVGYRPVFVIGNDDRERYWGLAIVVVTLEDFARAAGLNRLADSHYAYRLSQSEGGGEEAFLRSDVLPQNGVAVPFAVPNGEWVLEMAPAAGWPKSIAYGLEIALVVALAALSGYLIYEVQLRPQKLRAEIGRRTQELATTNRRLQAEVVERKQAEHALHTAQDALRSVLNTVGDGVLATDDTGKIQMANRQIERIFGYRAEEVLGMHLDSLISAEGLYQGLFDPIGAVPPFNSVGQRFEAIGSHRSGKVFPVEVYIAETLIGDRVHFTASVRDITRQKELERLRDEFVSTVSHELRTPLASVMGWIDTLLGGRPGPLTDVQQRFLHLANKSSERLDRLVEELLTVARINRGALVMNMLPYDPRKSLRAALDMMDGAASARSITFAVTDRWPAGEMIIGDHERVEQVLTNLLSNAIKFSPDGSTIFIRSEMRADAWRVEIQDQGIGIPEAEIPLLFQRFFRASTAVDAQIPGTGLGLYVCKAVVEGHHGTIEVTSQAGRGATVWVLLPVDGTDKFTGQDGSRIDRELDLLLDDLAVEPAQR
jgi:PAS domain S-box-containing protein